MACRRFMAGKFTAARLELYILIGILVFCSTYIGKTTMDYTITPRNIVWCIGTIILFLSIMARRDKVDLSFISRRIFIVFAAFLILSIFTLTKAANTGECFYEISRIFLMMVFLFCVVVIIKENNKNVLIKSIVLLALGLAVYGMYQYFKIPLNPAKRIGTMANMNLCSSAHVLLLPFSFYAIVRYSKIWKILGFVAAVTALFIVLFSLRTRSAWVALFVTGIIAASRTKKTLIFTAIAFIVLGAVVYGVKGNVIFNTASMNQRADMWGQSLNMAVDNPLGVGAGNWRVNIPHYCRWMSDTTRAIAFKTIYFQRPHNDEVWILAEQGFLGLVLYLAFFLFGLYYAVKSKNVLIYSCITAYLVISFFSFPKERTFHTVYIYGVLAAAIALYHKPLKFKFNPKIIYLGSVLTAVCLSFVMINFVIRCRTEIYIRRASESRINKHWGQVLDRTKDISPFSTLDSFGTPILYYQGTAHMMHQDFGCAVIELEGALKENPNHIYSLLQLGRCYMVYKRNDEAKACFEKVVTLYPGNKEAENNLAAIKAVAMRGPLK